MLVLVWMAVSASFVPVGVAFAEVERQVRYATESENALDQSYDLHPSPGRRGALVIFVDSRFWRERQADSLIEGSFVPGLVKAGHSVAVLRHRLGPDAQHPAAIKDVARGVAALLRRVESGEFDRERVFLAGHSSGAQLALLLALDPSWLADQGMRPEAFAGILSISGILETQKNFGGSAEEEALYRAAFADEAARAAASPSNHANPDLASLLLLVAAQDVPGYRASAARLAEALRRAGHRAVERFVANRRNHFSILELADPNNDALRHILPYLDSRPSQGEVPHAWQIASTWRSPPYSTADLHDRFSDLVETHPADERFNQALNRPFRTKPGARNRISVSRYQSIDLIRLVEALGASEVGRGDWLELRNARGEWSALRMDRMRTLSPRLVIGVDGERNLFRATDLYHTLRRYSWVNPKARRVDMARPLGAFLYFPDETPRAEEGNDFVGRYALTAESFRLRSDDPFDRFSTLSVPLREALITKPGCLGCHEFRGIGGRALHIRAEDGAPVGGHALPLERYPAIVWKRFIFDQAAVAKEVGASAIEFDPPLARALYELVVQERERSGVEAWIHPERHRPVSPARSDD